MAITEDIFRKTGSFLTGERIDGRRNAFFVERDFQKDFIFFFLLIISLLIIASGVAYYVIMRDTLEESLYVIHPRFRGTMEVLTWNLVLFFAEVSGIFFIIIIMTVDGMMRRITKSLMTYERIADRLAMLDLRRARGMEMKLFPVLRRQYLDLINKYSGDVLLLKEQLTRMGLLLTELREGAPDMPVEKKKMAMTELLELHCAVKSKIAEYKL